MLRLVTLAVACQCALTAGPALLSAQDRAVRQAAEALARRDSLDPLAHYELALVRLEGRQYATAETSLRHAVRLDPRLAVAWLALSVVRERDNDYWNALRRAGGDSAVAREARVRTGYYRRAFLLDPLVDITVLSLADPRGLGMLFDRSGGGFERTWAMVNDAWNQLITGLGSPDSMPPGLLWSHGMLSAHTNRLPMAILDMAALLNALRIIDQLGYTSQVPLAANEVRYVLAALHERAGNTLQAIALYQTVLENDLGNYMALVQMAGVYEVRQEWSEALRARRAAITTNPEDHTLKIDLAETLLRAGQAAAAESVLIDGAPDLMQNPRLYYVLGRVLWSLGRRSEAADAFHTFLQYAPSRWAAQRADAEARIAQR